LKWDIKELRRDKTVRGEISAIFGGKKVELRETARAVTPFGGLAVFVEFLRRVGFTEQVREAMPFELKSPNAIPAVETYTAFGYCQLGVVGVRFGWFVADLRIELILVSDVHAQQTPPIPPESIIFDVRNGDQQGKLVLTDTELAFESLTDSKHSRRWNYVDIRELSLAN
jgi:hypothetical protein